MRSVLSATTSSFAALSSRVSHRMRGHKIAGPMVLALATGMSVSIAAHAAGTPEARWIPQVTDTWQWQLTGPLNTSYDVVAYDIDLFDNSQATINDLKAQGRRVICYFSAGSAENWRPDYSRFQSSDLGKPLDSWPGERWVDTRSANVRSIMQSRMDLAVTKGCDAVEPDNVDAYDPQSKSGFPLTATTQLDYNRFIAREARARGLAVALKNDIPQVRTLEPDFDFVVNEQCHQFNECNVYSVFTDKGKPVFNAEYKKKWVNDPVAREQMCQKSRAANLRTLVLPVNLNDKFRYSCDE